MTKLTFARDDVRRVVLHMLHAKDWSQSWVETQYNDARSQTPPTLKPRPQLMFVHDDGVYLMSNGKPRDLIETSARDDGSGNGRSFAAYAKGLDPHKDSDVWEKARAAVGGDDFCEWIELSREQIDRIVEPGFKGLTIAVSPTSLEVIVR